MGACCEDEDVIGNDSAIFAGDSFGGGVDVCDFGVDMVSKRGVCFIVILESVSWCSDGYLLER